jgi:hypothetical protein
MQIEAYVVREINFPTGILQVAAEGAGRMILPELDDRLVRSRSGPFGVVVLPG